MHGKFGYRFNVLVFGTYKLILKYVMLYDKNRTLLFNFGKKNRQNALTTLKFLLTYTTPKCFCLKYKYVFLKLKNTIFKF